jgi:hypothetical protein
MYAIKASLKSSKFVAFDEGAAHGGLEHDASSAATNMQLRILPLVFIVPHQVLRPLFK